jgi:hypothetical protein
MWRVIPGNINQHRNSGCVGLESADRKSLGAYRVYTPNGEPTQLTRTVWLMDAANQRRHAQKNFKKALNFERDLLARSLLNEIPED